MSLDKDEIAKVARLARIEIPKDQVNQLAQDLNGILNLVDQMQAVDTKNIEPLSHPHDAKQWLRADRITESNQRESLLQNAPAQENGLFLVPKVID